MKGIHISCKSQASTAIFLAMENRNNSTSSPSSASTTALLSSSPAVDLIINDSNRVPKKKKDKEKKDAVNQKSGEMRVSTTTSSLRRSWSCTKPGDFISLPVSSARYFSGGEKVFSSRLSDSSVAQKMFSEESSQKSHASCGEKAPPSCYDFPDKVVVLRVSLHCKGCEKQMRKHISKMEGVTSFSIDFAEKKVTVRVSANMTPAEVLSRISKVKNAQLWAQNAVVDNDN